QHDDVGAGDLVGVAYEAYVNAGLPRQRLEVVEVRDERQADDRDVKRAGRAPARRLVQIERVLGGYEASVEVRDDSEHRHSGARAELGKPGRQYGRVAPESVDDEAPDPCAVIRIEQTQGAEQGGEHAAAIDVAHEQHRRVRHARDRHVDDVAIAQVDLGRAPGA